MPPTLTSSNAEKKRRSRARKPAAYHEREREASRKRMAIYRAKIRAEKRARHLKCLLVERDRAKIEARGSGRRRRLLRQWFDEHDLELDLAAVGDEKALRSYMTKIELHKIELQIAEFEISIMEDGGDKGGYRDLVVGADAVGSGGGCGEPVKGSAKAADATYSKSFVGGTGQEVDQWEPSNFNTIKTVTEEGPTIGSADRHPQACGSTEQAVHKYQLMQDQSALSNHQVDRLAKKDEKVFGGIPESKAGPAHPQMFLGSMEQVGADPSGPSNHEPDRLVEGDTKPAGVASDANVRGEEMLDVGREGGGVDELLAARREEVLPPMDVGCFDADGDGAESFCPDAYSW